MKENIGYCPNCKQVIFRRGNAFLEANDANKLSFETKCPHCQTPLRVQVGVEIIVYKDER